MPKNIHGGNKAKSSKNSNINVEAELVLKEGTDQVYAKVNKLLGSSMLEVQCFDGQKRLGLIRGSMKKKNWILLNDIVLVSLRSYQDKKCDIIARYTPEQVRELIKLEEIDSSIEKEKKDDDNNDNDCSFTFEDI